MKNKFELFLLIFSIFLIIFTFEIGLRLFNPFFKYTTNSMKIFKYSPNYIMGLKPNIRHRLYVHYKIMERTFDISTNSHGFRGKEFNAQKPINTFRIICMGDSNTFGWGVNDAQTYPFILQNTLNNNIKQTIEVVNGGIPGYDSLRGLILLKKKILNYKPDIVIVWFGPNDSSSYRMREKDRIENAKWEKIKYCLNKSCVFYLIKGVVKRTLSETKIFTCEERVSLDEFKNNLKEMVQIAKENNFLILFLNTPIPDSNFKFYDPANNKIQGYNKVLESMAKNKKIMFIDIASIFLNNKNILFTDNIHPNASGYQLIAKKIAQRMPVPHNSYQ